MKPNIKIKTKTNIKTILKINDLKLKVILGCLPFERVRLRPISIDIELELELSEVFITDDVADTLNYDKFCQELSREVEASKFNTVERLTYYVLEFCLKAKGVCRATVKVEKPGAIDCAKSISCLLTT